MPTTGDHAEPPVLHAPDATNIRIYRWSHSYTRRVPCRSARYRRGSAAPGFARSSRDVPRTRTPGRTGRRQRVGPTSARSRRAVRVSRLKLDRGHRPGSTYRCHPWLRRPRRRSSRTGNEPLAADIGSTTTGNPVQLPYAWRPRRARRGASVPTKAVLVTLPRVAPGPTATRPSRQGAPRAPPANTCVLGVRALSHLAARHN